MPGARVRHAQFGVGTVISVEPLDDDAKIVVRFPIGQKTLRAKYARLQPVAAIYGAVSGRSTVNFNSES